MSAGACNVQGKECTFLLGLDLFLDLLAELGVGGFAFAGWHFREGYCLDFGVVVGYYGTLAEVCGGLRGSKDGAHSWGIH